MRRFLLLFLTFAVVNASAPRIVRAAESGDPSELFLNAYMAVQQGEKFERDGNLKQALGKYKYAASLLDQISTKYPEWQRLVVEYRKKRTSENIGRIEPRVAGGGGAAATPGGAVETEAVLPTRDDVLFPPIATAPAAPSGRAVAPGDEVDAATSQIRDRIRGLSNDLREKQMQLEAMRQEKEDFATRLDSALKQLDKIKIDNAEVKAQLKQAQSAFQTASSDYNKDLEARKAMTSQIDQLQDALQKARDERDAAEEENSDFSRRLAKTRTKVDATAKERDAATQKITQLEATVGDAPKIAAQLDAAKKQIATLTQERDSVNKRAKELDGKLAEAAKATAQLEEAKKQIVALRTERDTANESNDEISTKLAAMQKQMVAMTTERDAARKQADGLTTKLTDVQKQVATVSAERDQIAKQRDQALSDLAKARDAQKQVDKLLADNTSLMQKLATAEKTIQTFNASAPEKDKELQRLQKEMGETKELLATTQKQNAEFQATMNDLQQQLDKTSKELVATKAGGASSAEKKKFEEENDLLRGIVLRQLKEQARRAQAKKLVLAELAKLEVQSDTLIKQIDYLGQPVMNLTDQEKALFKQPQIEVADAESMEFTIAAPKPDVAGSSAANASPTPGTFTLSGGTPPIEMASLGGAPNSLQQLTPQGLPSPSSQTPATESGIKTESGLPQVETQSIPSVPQELLADARTAKDLFERGQYRESEKTYEKMLSKAPNNVYILSNLGVVRFREGKMKLAEEAFKKAIAVAPQDTFSHCTLGIVYYQQGKYDDAVTALTKALAVNPKYAVAHNYLGITASQKGWQEAALKELETAIALDPNYADANFNLSVIYATQNPPNKEAARKFYKRATDLGAEPDSALEQLIK